MSTPLTTGYLAALYDILDNQLRLAWASTSVTDLTSAALFTTTR